MSQNEPKARLESGLLKIWYSNYRPAWMTQALLNVLEFTYKTLRTVSHQDKKIQIAKRQTTPPVLVIGNLIAGGAGKTPIVMAVCQYASARGKKVGIVSRGYGRSASTAIVIEPGQPKPTATDVGDEPLFLSGETHCPVAVCANRTNAVKLLLEHHPQLDLIVSDDGLQHHGLARQLEWVVFDERAQGNGRLLPAGPLREPLKRLDSVDAVLCSNISCENLSLALKIPAQHNWHAVEVKLNGFRNLKSGAVVPIEQAVENWKESRILAFTGIGNPEKLFKAIKDTGLNLESVIGLPDHFNYPNDFCMQFDQQILITSGKDAVKLVTTNPKVWVAEIIVELPHTLTDALEAYIGPTID